MEINVIVACTNDGGIGFNNTIPWYIPEDLKHFKRITTDVSQYPSKQNVVIMGRKTWESLPFKPLTSRINIVVSNTLISNNDIIVVQSLQEALEYAQNRNELLNDVNKVFIIGGVRLFNESLEHSKCDTLYITHILKSHKCDTFIDLNKIKENFVLSYEGNVNTFKNERYIFCKYSKSI